MADRTGKAGTVVLNIDLGRNTSRANVQVFFSIKFWLKLADECTEASSNGFWFDRAGFCFDFGLRAAWRLVGDLMILIIGKTYDDKHNIPSF
ncbi:Uncharacterized protein HZ326_24686 [Fusarium oxysporum f. sp. albedinis]|nr:Uncharacterized protein HZ326_24686 [Fusarium oxysporum f. sp. albedinis]